MPMVFSELIIALSRSSHGSRCTKRSSASKKPISRETIAAEFGERVAGLVQEATDDKSLPKPVRKQLQIETAPKKSRDAKLLKLADKVSNLRSVALSPPSHWPNQRRREYVDWASAVAAGLVGVSDWLDKQFEEARKLAEQSIPAEARDAS